MAPFVSELSIDRWVIGTSLLARAYLKQYPGRVKFKLAQGGSDVGVADVAAGRVSIGDSSRDPKSSDPKRRRS